MLALKSSLVCVFLLGGYKWLFYKLVQFFTPHIIAFVFVQKNTFSYAYNHLTERYFFYVASLPMLELG
jgi:hypothetical protein